MQIAIPSRARPSEHLELTKSTFLDGVHRHCLSPYDAKGHKREIIDLEIAERIRELFAPRPTGCIRGDVVQQRALQEKGFLCSEYRREGNQSLRRRTL